MNEGSILVVDDDREIVRSIAIHLEKEGYSVLCAYNGLEALDMVMSQPVCLIIIDVMMPKMDGLSAIMKIREKRNLPSSYSPPKVKIPIKFWGCPWARTIM